MAKLQTTRGNLGRIFNSGSGRKNAIHLLCAAQAYGLTQTWKLGQGTFRLCPVILGIVIRTFPV